MKPYFERDGITLYHGDCREILPSLSGVDFCLTDPPYEMVAKGGGIGADRQYLADIDGFTDCGFDVALLQRFPSWACFCAKTQLQQLIGAVGDRRWMLITWNKPNPTPLVNGNYLPDTEYVIHAFPTGRLFGEFRDRSRFIVHPAGRGTSGHPNEKPIPVVSKLVRLGTKPGDLICDPFAGSGTTLLAARSCGRRAIGIELEERYCEIAAKRLAQGVLSFAPRPEATP